MRSEQLADGANASLANAIAADAALAAAGSAVASATTAGTNSDNPGDSYSLSAQQRARAGLIQSFSARQILLWFDVCA